MAIGPVIAEAEAQAAALVGRAEAELGARRQEALDEAEALIVITLRVSRSSQKALARLERLAAATVKLEANAAVLDEMWPSPGEPEVDRVGVGPSPVEPEVDRVGVDPPRVVGAEHAPRDAVRAPANGGLSRTPSALEDGLRAATHVALTMAVRGGSRDEVAAHLRDAHHLEDPGPVLDHVFGPV
jgi:hypothetical protein